MSTQTYYSFVDHTKILDGEGRHYHLKIRDLADEEKPREKMLKYGVSVLTSPELLAIMLSNGTKKEGILEMSERLIKEYGEGGVMSEKNPTELSKKFDIPIVKSMQIIACAELGRRFFQKKDASVPMVRTAREVFEYVHDMRTLSKEHLRGLYLNAHYKVIHDEVISIGTVDGNMIHPREVFKPALEYSAVAVILVHNHPSGSLDPSQADIEVTSQIIEAGKLLGVSLIDHVIVTKDSFISIPAKYS